jgi:hypothetical protein
MASWSGEQLDRISGSGELQIASRRTDGTLAVRSRSGSSALTTAGVYVRTWYRRTTGWFGHVIDLAQARIRVPGLEPDVIIADVGRGAPELRASVDAAYRTKYGRFGHQLMVTDDAAATTLRLDPQ